MNTMSNPVFIRITLFFALGMIVSTPALDAQTTWYVDDNAIGDPGPGDPSVSDPLDTYASPFVQDRQNSNA